MELNWDTFRPNKEAMVITTLDAHAAGEPLRIITSGLPEVKGGTMLERRRFMLDHLDYIRQALMWEPRGHSNMYGCAITKPVNPEADVGVLFMHNQGYSTMCGHGIIALVTVLVETGTFPVRGQRTSINLDTPAGLVRATAYLDRSGHVEQVSFQNVPSFLYARDVELVLSKYGTLLVDVAYGGAFYAFTSSANVGLKVIPENTEQLVAAAEAITTAVNDAISVEHPLEPDLSFVYGTILIDSAENPVHHSRNICVFADAEVDRSPTGTGVSARLALHHARGEIVDGQEIIVESVLGSASTFHGSVKGRAKVGSYDAIVPEVSGKAFITGKHEFFIDKQDELGKGFLLS
ncbi:MAG TPA: proline racemase family protein [Ktedonobacteraceae bacterium]|nr:proline racemase family protein [Ktedonobacteraceae bacterium]